MKNIVNIIIVIIAVSQYISVSIAASITYSGSHNFVWGQTTWDALNRAILLVCNADPYDASITEKINAYGYDVAEGQAVTTDGSPNCESAMKNLLDQCFDTANGHYHNQGRHNSTKRSHIDTFFRL